MSAGQPGLEEAPTPSGNICFTLPGIAMTMTPSLIKKKKALFTIRLPIKVLKSVADTGDGAQFIPLGFRSNTSYIITLGFLRCIIPLYGKS